MCGGGSGGGQRECTCVSVYFHKVLASATTMEKRHFISSAADVKFLHLHFYHLCSNVFLLELENDQCFTFLCSFTLFTGEAGAIIARLACIFAVATQYYSALYCENKLMLTIALSVDLFFHEPVSIKK